MQEALSSLRRTVPSLAVLFLGLGGHCAAQSSLRSWGDYGYDTDGRIGRFTRVAAGVECMAVLRADGRIFVNGITINLNDRPPVIPSGQNYVDMSISQGGGCAIVSDGSMRLWGSYTTWGTYHDVYPPPPPLPAGVSFVQAEAAGHVLALRSDGLVESWINPAFPTYGETIVPAFPPGVVAQRVIAADRASFILMTDGSILAWGQHTAIQTPPLPVGVGYTALSISKSGNPQERHGIALRSDGSAISWGGSNSWGQCNVPALPSGMFYTHVAAADAASVAVRSDDVILVWGSPGHDLLNPPQVPVGRHVVQLDAGTLSAVALLDDGAVLTWGSNGFLASSIPGLVGQDLFVGVSRGYSHTVAATERFGVLAWGEDWQGCLDVPVELTRGRVAAVEAGEGFSAALRIDGGLTMWGWNGFGQCNVPPLPTGVRYTDVALGFKHSIAVRSDGQAVAWGTPTWGETAVPALPPGVHYVACDARNHKSLLLRSDGQIEVFGDHYGVPAQLVVPPLPAGLRYTDVAGALPWNIALRSDGTPVWWGSVGSGVPFWVQLSSLVLPFGVYYVEVDCDDDYALLRRSDGRIDVCGNAKGVGVVPELDPGTSYVQIDGGRTHTATARVGPTQTYTSFAHGCAGSMLATRLIPSDTPHIGATLEVRLFDLPANIALMTMGLTRLPSSVALDAIGMPGCTAEISIDAVLPLVGQGNQAVWSLPIPNRRSLVGMRFYNQAVVLDPGANVLGLVTSDAAEGVVGDR